MKTVYKYEAPGPGQTLEIKMPLGAEILTFKRQYDKYVIWALVWSENSPVERLFTCVGTGYDMPKYVGEYEVDEYQYIGTVQEPSVLGELVWHLFEVLL